MMGSTPDNTKYNGKVQKLDIKPGYKTTTKNLQSIMEQVELFDPDTGPQFNIDDFNPNLNFTSPNSPLANSPLASR